MAGTGRKAKISLIQKPHLAGVIIHNQHREITVAFVN